MQKPWGSYKGLYYLAQVLQSVLKLLELVEGIGSHVLEVAVRLAYEAFQHVLQPHNELSCSKRPH